MSPKFWCAAEKHKPTCMKTVCGEGRRKRGRDVSAQKKCEGRIFFFFWWKSPRGGGMRCSVITCLPRSLELFLLLRNPDNTASQWKTKRPLWLVSRLRPVSLPLRRLLWDKVRLTCKKKKYIDLQQRSFFSVGLDSATLLTQFPLIYSFTFLVAGW